MKTDLRLRGSFLMWVVFVLLGGAVLVGCLSLPWSRSAAKVGRLLEHFERLRIESRETLDLRTDGEAIDFGLAAMRTEPFIEVAGRSDSPPVFGMRFASGSVFMLTSWYRPVAYEQWSAPTEGHLTAEECVAFVEGPRPSYWGLMLAGGREIERWGRLARAVQGESWDRSHPVRLLETSDGVAIVSCQKDRYVGDREWLYSLCGRWWAADGSVSFGFRYLWPEGEDPKDRGACLEMARDLVSRLRMARDGAPAGDGLAPTVPM